MATNQNASLKKRTALKKKSGLCTYQGCLAEALTDGKKTQIYCPVHREWYREYMRRYMRERTLKRRAAALRVEAFLQREPTEGA